MNFREEVRRALLTRNFGIIESLPISAGRKRALWRLFNFRGKRSGVEKLDAIAELLGDERVFLDFGTVRPLPPYYTDVIFEVYSPRLGKPLGGGGGEYLVGGNKKAIGFALDLGALLKLYRGAGKEEAGAHGRAWGSLQEGQGARENGHSRGGEAMRFVLPKGRLLKPSIEFLRKAGVELELPNGRELVSADGRVLLARAFDVPVYVEHGGVEVGGIAGSDVVLERGSDLFIPPLELPFGKCRISVAVPGRGKVS